ncbi:MAG: HAD family phosphatase, partial [Muribaculaceae bacterium]|nr:HAD family phosphatase [Muribaculaceae bacterium]
MNNDNIGFLFDLDGVLIDSESEYTRIWEEIDRHFPTGIENFAIRIKGQTLPEILNANFSPETHSKVIDMLNSMEQRMRYRMLPGAQEMLDTLRSLGIGCALVTSSNDMKMRHLREELPHLESYINASV